MQRFTVAEALPPRLQGRGIADEAGQRRPVHARPRVRRQANGRRGERRLRQGGQGRGVLRLWAELGRRRQARPAQDLLDPVRSGRHRRAVVARLRRGALRLRRLRLALFAQLDRIAAVRKVPMYPQVARLVHLRTGAVARVERAVRLLVERALRVVPRRARRRRRGTLDAQLQMVVVPADRDVRYRRKVSRQGRQVDRRRARRRRQNVLVQVETGHHGSDERPALTVRVSRVKRTRSE